MKSIILYSALKPRGKHYTAVKITGTSFVVFVRVQLVNGDVLEALDKMRPRKCEIVLNSVPAEEIK